MQQTSLLLDIGDLTPITDIASDDAQQLEQQIALCRASDRHELAAPYALQLCQYHNQRDERENCLWFDAIAEDDIFLVKALVASGFDINATYNYINEDDDTEFGAAITLALFHNSCIVLDYILTQPELSLDIIGYTQSDYDHPTLSNPYPTDENIIPFLVLYHRGYADHLNNIEFDVNIRWGLNNQWSALKLAVTHYDLTLTQWLLSHHSDPNQLAEDYSEESVFGWLVNDYINLPTADKLALIKLMLEHGASTSAKNWEGYPVLYVAWQEKNQPLIELFELGYFQEEWEELEQEKIGLADEITQIRMKLVDQNMFDEHAKRNYVMPELRIGDDHSHYRAPTLKISILAEMRIKGEFIPASWITDISIIQQDEDIQIYIEQQDHQVTAMAVTLPDELHYISYPFTSSIAMGLDFIQRPLSWWQEVEHYLHRYHITLIDPQFFDTRRDQLEQGYC